MGNFVATDRHKFVKHRSPDSFEQEDDTDYYPKPPPRADTKTREEKERPKPVFDPLANEDELTEEDILAMKRKALRATAVSKEEMYAVDVERRYRREMLENQLNFLQRLWIDSPCNYEDPPFHCLSLFRKIVAGFTGAYQKYESYKNRQEEEQLGKRAARIKRLKSKVKFYDPSKVISKQDLWEKLQSMRAMEEENRRRGGL